MDVMVQTIANSVSEAVEGYCPLHYYSLSTLVLLHIKSSIIYIMLLTYLVSVSSYCILKVLTSFYTKFCF